MLWRSKQDAEIAGLHAKQAAEEAPSHKLSKESVYEVKLSWFFEDL